MNIFLARQPVYDADLNVIAYELLYRSGEANSAGIIDDPDQASSQVLLNAFIEMGIEQIVGDLPALINVTRSFLETNKLPSNLSKKLILEILETEVVDPDFVKVVDGVISKGYRFALDDFIFDRNWALLLPRANIVKYDVMALGMDGVEKQLAILNKFKEKYGELNIQLLAEKVETQEEFEHYKSKGFTLFQGYFLAKPKVLKNRGVPASKLVILNLLAELNNQNAQVDALEKLISQDARLSYKVLRVVNSASFGLSRQIDTIQQAIVIIGLRELRCWASLMALSLDDGKPHELLVTAMIRARMSQVLAEQIGIEETNVYFTAGLFSLMDALMDAPLEEVISTMPFGAELVDGVLHRKGQIGQVLHAITCYEMGKWDEMNQLPGVGPDELWEAYLAALEWAQVASHSLAG